MQFCRILGVRCFRRRRREGVEWGCALYVGLRSSARHDVRKPREVAGPHRFLSSVSLGCVFACTAVKSALAVNLEELGISKTREMPRSRHVDRTVSRKTHETRPQQQQLLRRSARLGSPALLLPFLLLADKPERTLGWVHIPGNTAGVQAGRTHSTAPASPVLSLGMLHRAVRRQRITRSSCREAGTTGAGLEGALLETPAGEGSLAVQARDAASRRIGSTEAKRRTPTTGSSSRGGTAGKDRVKQQMKQLGRQGMWKEALEQLEREGSEGTHPVSPSFLQL